MAKKKRRLVEEPQEEYEFIPTEFNEREFILKDIYMTKVFMVIAVLAIIVGIVGAVICNHTGWWWLATIISFVVCALLTKILGALKFRVDMLEMKSMLGNYLLFLMLALGICILLINEPFASIL